MSRDTERLIGRHISYDSNFRIEPKRGHQWFTDINAPELFSNKKQAVESVSNMPVLGTSHINVPSMQSASNFQSLSRQFSDRLFRFETMHTSNIMDKVIPSFSDKSITLNMGGKDIFNHYGSNSCMDLSIFPSSSTNFGGKQKVRANQVKDSNNDICIVVGQSHIEGDDDAIALAVAHNKVFRNARSLHPTYDEKKKNAVIVHPELSKTNGRFILMGHAFNKEDGNLISISRDRKKGDYHITLMGQAFNKGDACSVTMGPSYEKHDSNDIPLDPSFSKGPTSFTSVGLTFDKANENFISMGPSYTKGDDDIMSIDPNFNKINSNITSMCYPQDKQDSDIPSTGHDNNKGDGNIVSFGGFHDGPEFTLFSSIYDGYDMLITDKSPTQASEAYNLEDFMQSNTDTNENNALKSNSKNNVHVAAKMKHVKSYKKAPSNNFPLNVKGLLSTGIFDGVSVKYVSWTREKSVKGLIRGTKYLCGCEECNFFKAINAYEFERHAGCKTKHPNSHIYFDNGKTVYAVVQELKNTPQDMLFDVIQVIIGSPINQRNFQTWKASYQAVTRELQNLYGKE